MNEDYSVPSTERNLPALVEALADVVPSSGQALEIASGTGQHIAALAAAHPGVHWQPSDVTEARFDAVRHWREQAGVANLARPVLLDACTPGWAAQWGPLDVVLLVNLLHLVSDAQVSVLLDEVAKAVGPRGIFVLYGPFLRGGKTTSEGDAAFHAQLQEQDSAIGYKEIEVVASVLQVLGFSVETRQMPANNLLVLARKAVAT